MSVQIPLDQMTLAEKLEVMEAIWADLSRRPDDLPSPDWHKEVVEERKRLADEGKLKFLDCRRDPTWIESKLRAARNPKG